MAIHKKVCEKMRLHDIDVSEIFKKITLAGTLGTSIVLTACSSDSEMSTAVHDANIRSEQSWNIESHHQSMFHTRLVHVLPIEMQAVKEQKLAGIIISHRSQIPDSAHLSPTSQMIDIGDGSWLWFDYGSDFELARPTTGELPKLNLAKSPQKNLTSAQQFAFLAGAGAYIYDQRYDQYYKATYFIEPLLSLVDHHSIGVSDTKIHKNIAAYIELGTKNKDFPVYVPVGEKIVSGLDEEHQDDMVFEYQHPVQNNQNQDNPIDTTDLRYSGTPPPSPSSPLYHGGITYIPTYMSTYSSYRPVYIPPIMRGSPVVEAESGHTASFGRSGGFSIGRAVGGLGHAGGGGGEGG